MDGKTPRAPPSAPVERGVIVNKLLRSASLLAALVLASLAGARTPAWAQLASTPWPMFQHDLLHTGRSPLPGPSALDLKWTYAATSWVKTQTAVGDGVLYFGAGHHPMCAVDAATGAELWCFPDGGDANQSSPAIGQDGTIYEGARDNKVWAIDADGLEVWSFKIPLDGDVFSSPAIAPSGTIYTACGCLSAGILHAFNPGGSLKWKLKLGKGGIRNSSPAVVDEAGSRFIYIGSVDGWLRKVKDNGTGGSLEWEIRVGTALRDSSPSVAADGTVYIGSNTGLWAVRPNGTLRWHFVTNGVVDTTAAISLTGRIYVSSFKTGKRTLYGIDPATASPGYHVAWTRVGAGTSTSNFSQTPSAVIDGDGNVYAAIGKTVLKLTAAGVQLDDYTVGADVIALSLGDGVLYVSAKDGNLYAFGQ